MRAFKGAEELAIVCGRSEVLLDVATQLPADIVVQVGFRNAVPSPIHILEDVIVQGVERFAEERFAFFERCEESQTRAFEWGSHECISTVFLSPRVQPLHEELSNKVAERGWIVAKI